MLPGDDFTSMVQHNPDKSLNKNVSQNNLPSNSNNTPCKELQMSQPSQHVQSQSYFNTDVNNILTATEQTPNEIVNSKVDHLQSELSRNQVHLQNFIDSLTILRNRNAMQLHNDY